VLLHRTIGEGLGILVNLSHGMADLVSYGNVVRDIEQALIALKKGAQLLKYGRKGKPKFCPFRLSNDETSLIWISNGGEKRLKLATVSKIVPGQRTVISLKIQLSVLM
jgi:hypothetical protein